jgi:hypothetical protein
MQAFYFFARKKYQIKSHENKFAIEKTLFLLMCSHKIIIWFTYLII